MYFRLPLLLFGILFGFSAATGNASQSVADQALSWMKCPPKNPFIHDRCTTQCCSGSNWDLTCIGFVEQVSLRANGKVDPQLIVGFPKVGQIYGNVTEAFRAMEKAGRAHYDLNPSPGAAVFFAIAGFSPGHIVISSGLIGPDGGPLMVTTGAPSWKTGIHLESLQEMKSRAYWKYLGWAEL